MNDVKEIKGFVIEHEPNGAHFSYMEYFSSLINNELFEKLGCHAVCTPFNALFLSEKESLKQEQSNMLSQQIAEADTVNDNLYRYISKMIRAQADSPVAAMCGAAKTARHLLDTYGDLTKKSYADEMGLLKNFLADCEQAPYKEAFTTLVLGPTLEELAKGVVAFEKLYNERNTQMADASAIVPMRTIRPQVDKEYRYIVKVLNALWLANYVGANDAEKAAAMEPVIEAMNARIAKEETLLAQKRDVRRQVSQRRVRRKDKFYLVKIHSRSIFIPS